MEEEYISPAEFSKLVGVSKAAISQYIKKGNKEGRLTLKEINGKIKIEKLESLKSWNTYKSFVMGSATKKEKQTKTPKIDYKKHIDDDDDEPSNREPNNNKGIYSDASINDYLDESLSPAEINMAKARIDATRKALEIEEIKGRLVSRELVERILPNILVSFKQQVVLIPERCADSIAQKLKDEHDVTIDRFILLALVKDSIADDLTRTVNFLKKGVKI